MDKLTVNRFRSPVVTFKRLSLLAICLAGLPVLAQASSDFDECIPPLAADLRYTDLCWHGKRPSVAFLHPENDTQINFLLLLEDAGLANLRFRDDTRSPLRAKVPFLKDRLGDDALYYERNLEETLVDPLPEGDEDLAFDEETEEEAEEVSDEEAEDTESEQQNKYAFIPIARTLGIEEEPLKKAVKDIDWYYWGRCISNDDNSITALFTEIQASDISANDKKQLAMYRLQLAGKCNDVGESEAQAPTSFESELARDFLAYINAARAFYAGDYAAAAKGFTGLTKSRQPWLMETAFYMLARVYLNDANDSHGDSGDANEGVRHATYDDATQALDRYLKFYPAGRYKDSAIGLYRRISWLALNPESYIVHFDRMLTDLMAQKKTLKNEDAIRLSEEINTYYWFAEYDYYAETMMPAARKYEPRWQSPILASVPVLARMRGAMDQEKILSFSFADNKRGKHHYADYVEIEIPDLEYEPPEGPRWIPFSRAHLEANLKQFPKESERLSNYLLLAHTYFVEKDYDKVLAQTANLTPSDSLSNIEFSQFVLRGSALERKAQWQAARELWQSLAVHAKRPLQQAQLELNLATNLEKSHKVGDAFVENSPITTPRVRHTLLEYAAPPTVLRQVLQSKHIPAQEKALALATLLYKYTVHQQYGELATLIKQYPPQTFENVRGLNRYSDETMKAAEIACKPLQETLNTLAKLPNDPTSLMCYSPIFRERYGRYKQLREVRDHHLGATVAKFPGTPTTPMDIYLKVLAMDKVPDETRAYAYHRALTCFQPGGENDCGAQVILESQRKQWFSTLKKQYKHTHWGKKQRYWW